MRSILLLSALTVGGLAACASPTDSIFEPKDGGSDEGADVHLSDGGFLSVPPETYGVGVTATDAAIFKKPPGTRAPFVFDPPADVALPRAWPSPAFLVHTSEAPVLVRIELTSGATVAAFTAKPVAAQGEPGSEGAWWNVTFPPPLFDSMKALSPTGAVSWRVLYATASATAPDGVSSGALKFLATGDVPDVTYWQIAPSDEYAVRRLKVGGPPATLLSNQSSCIGCHTVSPDGQDVIYNVSLGGFRLAVERPQVNGPAVPSPFLTPPVKQLLADTSLLIPAVSAGAWSDPTGRYVAGIYQDQGLKRVAIMRLDGPGGLSIRQPLAKNETFEDAAPAWHPDGSRIVFAGTSSSIDGYVAPKWYAPNATSDLYSVPVTLGSKGVTFGQATPVPFASATDGVETWPDFSNDGKLLVLMRAPKGAGGYDTPEGEIVVMPADATAAPVRLSANDAPSDASVHQGGLTNSWPRFARTPPIAEPDGSAYYPLIFSSRRGPSTLWKDKNRPSGRPLARMFYTLVRVQPNGTVSSTGAILIPGQKADSGAHTPDNRALTSVPPPPPN